MGKTNTGNLVTAVDDLRALVANLDTLRAAATAGEWEYDADHLQLIGGEDSFVQISLHIDEADAALIVAAVNAIPAISAGVAALVAQVEELSRMCKETAQSLDEVEDERDALAARLDAAEKVCRWAEDKGEAKLLVDAWRELAP